MVRFDRKQVTFVLTQNRSNASCQPLWVPADFRGEMAVGTEAREIEWDLFMNLYNGTG